MLLAPGGPEIARVKHVQLLENLRAQGFVRARVNGQVIDLDDELPTLELRRKHTIEAVIDRFRGCAVTWPSAWPKASKPRCGWPAALPWWLRWTRTQKTGEILFSSRFALPGLRLQPVGAGAANVFVQQPERCLRRPVTDWV